jgi:hypothetical protein
MCVDSVGRTSVGESLRAVLNEIAEVAPDWLLGVVSPDWFDRYVHRFELQRFPKGEQAKALLRKQVGEDSWHRLASARPGASGAAGGEFLCQWRRARQTRCPRDRVSGPAQRGVRMATRNGLWRERFPGGLAAAAGALSPRTPLAALVSRTTQSWRGGDPRELFRCDLPGLPGQSTLCTKREKHKGRILTLSPQPIHEARERRRAEQSTSALRASLWLAGRHRRHDFRRDSQSWAAPGALSWSAKDAAASQSHRGGHQRGKASVSCCKGLLLDSRLDPGVLCLRLHVCDCTRRHDVRTKFPSRVIHTPN